MNLIQRNKKSLGKNLVTAYVTKVPDILLT